jgi:hypothetical protein
VIATDKPVSFLAAASQARTLDYPFTIVEMRFPKDSVKGEGKMLVGTALCVKNGRLELENYGQEPVRLPQVTQQREKKQEQCATMVTRIARGSASLPVLGV